MTPPDLVNLDTGAAHAFVSEGSPVRAALRAVVRGMTMIMCETARDEFWDAVVYSGGPLEKARTRRFMLRVTPVPDMPTPRAVALQVTGGLGGPDRIIFGTGDRLGALKATTDGRALRAAAAQGVYFAAALFPPAPLKGR